MENLDEIKTGWMSIGDAAKVAGFTRQNVYHYIKTHADIRTRYVKARREVRVEDLLAAINGPQRIAEAKR